MRLLFLSSVYPSAARPTHGPFNGELVRALARNHEVRVIAPVPWHLAWRHKGGRAPEQGAGLPDAEVERPTFYYPPGMLRSHHAWFFWQSAARTIRARLESFRPHAVLSYWAYPDGAVALRAARRAGVPGAVIIGGSDVLLQTRPPRRWRAVLDTLEAADALFPVGPHLRDRILALGAPPERVHVFRQGVDTERFSPGDRSAARLRLGVPAEGTVVLWIGRMVAVKGLDVLLDACERLAREDAPFRLCLVGDGPLRPALEARVASGGLRERVVFLGAVSPADLPDWYRAADLTVLPSRSEGLPNVLLESLACGTPFLASRVGSVPTLTEHPDRDLVPPEDPAALAAALRHRLREPPSVARTAIVRYRWTDTADHVVAVLSALGAGAR